uniref:Uncharacterized protein n=1 Tax=Avena sativa TaxID=4498 RepID=A0ACD5T9W6_AVESA
MPAGGTKTRFGRCPYCRAMICQNTSAAVYYCSKCRTPIRGKNTEPTEDEADKALSRLEILSAVDTASVFSDEELDASCTQASVTDDDGDQPTPLSCGYSSNSDANSQGVTASSPSPYRGGFGSPRDGTSRSNGGVSDNHVVTSDRQEEVRSVKDRVTELRVSSRRTRRASSASDPTILRCRDFSVPDQETARNAGEQQLRRSPMSSRELGTSVSMSGLDPSAVTASPLSDPAFQRDLLHALDKLRGMLVSIELQPRPASSSARGALTRRESRLFRRMESQLARELPAAYAAEAHAPRRKARNYATAGSGSWSSASSSSGQGARSRKRHCFPVHGAAPFVVCGECSKLLQAPNSLAPSRRGVTKLRCGGCGEVLELRSAGIATHARRASRACSATRESGSGSCHGSDELERAASSGGGEQQVPALLLYRALGFDSMSPLLQSQRY